MQTTYLPGRGLVAAVISSIGIWHEGTRDLVTDGLYLDLRRALRNSADDPTMRSRTGMDADVHAHVLAGALADVILREAARRLSVPATGTALCVQNRARLIRALYTRLDRLTAPLPATT
ncbi:hypothetical protein ACFQ7A_30755 [Streptomyces sp. NPDC056528]|uniref:hypothetical protein n=1 Tax=Streptomyces sp. NPDC056528 TaxID=3345854 RepID=UPI0036B06AB3